MRVPARLLRAPAPPWLPSENVALADHRAFIRSLPCASCGKPAPSECARVRIGGNDGGIGEAGDRYLVPLCGPPTIWQACCHDYHYFDRARFWAGLGIDPLAFAMHLWRVSGDLAAGQHLIILARQRIRRHSVRRHDAARKANPGRLDSPPSVASVALPQRRAVGDTRIACPEPRS